MTTRFLEFLKTVRFITVVKYFLDVSGILPEKRDKWSKIRLSFFLLQRSIAEISILLYGITNWDGLNTIEALATAPSAIQVPGISKVSNKIQFIKICVHLNIFVTYPALFIKLCFILDVHKTSTYGFVFRKIQSFRTNVEKILVPE